MNTKNKKELEVKREKLSTEIQEHRDMAFRLEGAIMLINEMLEDK